MSTNKEKFTPGPWMVRHYTMEDYDEKITMLEGK